VVAGLFAGILIAELMVRVTGGAPYLIRIRVDDKDSAFVRSKYPIMGYEYRPLTRLDDEKRPAHSHINSHGQWDIERVTAKPAGIKRIIVIGDSVVVSDNILDLNYTMTRQLEKKLQEQSLPVEVLNFGVTGYCMLAEVELLETKGVQFQPDLVVVVFVWNDYDNFNNSINEVSWHTSGWVRHLFVSSHLFRMLSVRLNWFDLQRPYRIPRVPEGTEVSRELVTASVQRRRWIKAIHRTTFVDEHFDAIGENNVQVALSRLRQLADEHGFAVQIVIWPDFTNQGIDDIDGRDNFPATENQGWRQNGPDGPMVIEQLAKQHGFETTRISSYFKTDFDRQKMSSSPASVYTTGDGMHPNERGCSVAAQALLDVIQKRTDLIPAQ